jgi:steroid 5-alpha reductase family enzyme
MQSLERRRGAGLLRYLSPLLPFALAALPLAAVDLWREAFILNGLCQIGLFVWLAHWPAWRTQRMSYVDLAWPWGLCAIGAAIGLMAPGDLSRRLIVLVMFVLMGARMGLRSLRALRAGRFGAEFNRYRYQRLRWRRLGKRHVRLAQQVDIASQALLNVTLLAAAPLVFASIEGEPSRLEGVALVCWVGAFAFEAAADRQKAAHLARARAQGRPEGVCDTGLWRYARHPNYFGEWLVWIALAGLATAGLAEGKLALAPDMLAGVTAVLIAAPAYMYVGLVWLTGVKPAEHYSRRNRPGYAAYQARTNAFFPGPPRPAGAPLDRFRG